MDLTTVLFGNYPIFCFFFHDLGRFDLSKPDILPRSCQEIAKFKRINGSTNKIPCTGARQKQLHSLSLESDNHSIFSLLNHVTYLPSFHNFFPMNPLLIDPKYYFPENFAHFVCLFAPPEQS